MTSPAAQRRDLPGDHDHVPAGHPLRPGVLLAETSRFGEDTRPAMPGRPAQPALKA